MKKDVLLDVDGIIRDMVTTSIQIYKEFYNVRDRTKYNDIKVYDMSVAMPGITDFYKFFTEHGSYIFGEAKPYKGAIEFVKQLDEIANIHIVTNQVKGTEKHTLRWIEQWKIPYNSLHFAKNKNIVKGDYLIDDYTNNLEGFSGTPVCLTRPWNSDYEGVKFDTFSEIIKYIRDQHVSR